MVSNIFIYTADLSDMHQSWYVNFMFSVSVFLFNCSFSFLIIHDHCFGFGVICLKTSDYQGNNTGNSNTVYDHDK